MRITVSAPDALRSELAPMVRDLVGADGDVAHELVVEQETDGTWRLVADGAVAHRGIEPSVVAATVVWWLNTVVAASAPHLLVHAAVVGARSAVLLPGASGAGKSTLAAACIRAGLSYLSDEYAAFDPTTGTIAAYPKPLDLGAAGLVAASDLRAGAVVGRLAPGGIVFPRFAPGAPPSRTALTPGGTVLALAAHATNLVRTGGAALPWLAGLARACPAWETTYPAAAGPVALVRDLATAPATPVTPAPVLGPITASTTTVELGTELVVHDAATGQVHLLAGDAAVVWASVPDADGDLEALVGLGTARGAADAGAVRATIDHLRAQGLLTDGRAVSAGYDPAP